MKSDLLIKVSLFTFSMMLLMNSLRLIVKGAVRHDAPTAYFIFGPAGVIVSLVIFYHLFLKDRGRRDRK